ncbi:MAG TPA: pyrroloquinoline quinone-dependent dehydrogenase [Vicinamibacteria bacterium]|nr:pyrroloquinoline quinone-dependent dehydrogenase [Vicinamibacteria bacterium]
MSPSPASSRGWPALGGGPQGIRYSPLDQINRTNVGQLEVAWTFDSGEEGGLQAAPIVVNGVVYTTTPKHHVVALDAATGTLIWKFDSGIPLSGANRGVTYWEGGGDRRLFTGQDHFVYALDARTGQPIPTFGNDGRIDLAEDLGRPPAEQSIRLTTPGIVYKDLLIVGGRVSEGLPATPGDVRAYDVRSGARRWSFHTIPHPGEAGYETWPRDAWKYSGAANNWAGMALDEARGIVYVPTGSAAADFYGANRAGDNLYANSLLALDAATGKRIWHFQAVHHDVWDRDFPSQPGLVTVTRDGARVDAVAQTSKQGYVFLFDRATGAPLFPIEERRFPASTLEGEVTAATQPLPTRPAPFSRQRLTEDMLTRRTPEAHQAAVEAFRKLRSDGPFVPFVAGQDTIIFPGYDGGAEWGGSAFDPESGLLYVNANEMAWTGGLAPSVPVKGGRTLYLRSCASCHRDNRRGAPPQIPSLIDVARRRPEGDLYRIVRKGEGRMPGFPTLSDDEVDALVHYLKTGQSRRVSPSMPAAASLKYRFTGYKKFLDPDGYPAIAPPWGTLTAIDLDTGAHAWQVPLGEYPKLAAAGLTNTGSENYGGPVVTAGGLVFIGATCFDKKVRAFDKATGAALWAATLPFSAIGTPATYEVGGRQFVLVPAGGGKDGGPSGGLYVAFALPRAGPASGH